MKSSNYWGKDKPLLDRLERKYGKYAVPDLMKYMSVIYVLGYFICTVKPEVYDTWLMLDFTKVLHGQIWRLLTFILCVTETNILIVLLSVVVNMYIGRMLESVWGTFKFNVYYFSGILFSIIGSLIIYIVSAILIGQGLSFPFNAMGSVNMAMFLALAAIFPDMQFNLYFLIPIKAKWLGIIDMVIIGYTVIDNCIRGTKCIVAGAPKVSMIFFTSALVTILSVLNFFIFYYMSKKKYKKSKSQKNYKKQVKTANRRTRHQCEICKKTEEDDENLEFRYCSKCDGNHEYCMEHLFTHEHIKKFTINIDKDSL